MDRSYNNLWRCPICNEDLHSRQLESGHLKLCYWKHNIWYKMCYDNKYYPKEEIVSFVKNDETNGITHCEVVYTFSDCTMGIALYGEHVNRTYLKYKVDPIDYTGINEKKLTKIINTIRLLY